MGSPYPTLKLVHEVMYGAQAVHEAARDSAGVMAVRERQEQAIGLEVPYWDAARSGGGGADPDGGAPASS